MLGQCPYPQKDMATGIAFAVPKGEDSPSLKIIRDELFDYTNDITIDENFDETMSHWTNQGILLLNSALTVEPYKPGSHIHLWQDFTKQLIKYISDEKTAIIFVLMGKAAQHFNQYIDKDVHYVINTAHPAADTYGNKKLFRNSGVFEQIDTLLFKLNGEKIKWLK